MRKTWKELAQDWLCLRQEKNCIGFWFVIISKPRVLMAQEVVRHANDIAEQDWMVKKKWYGIPSKQAEQKDLIQTHSLSVMDGMRHFFQWNSSSWRELSNAKERAEGKNEWNDLTCLSKRCVNHSECSTSAKLAFQELQTPQVQDLQGYKSNSPKSHKSHVKSLVKNEWAS